VVCPARLSIMSHRGEPGAQAFREGGHVLSVAGQEAREQGKGRLSFDYVGLMGEFGSALGADFRNGRVV
jgi:hypothetical protein